MRGPGTGPFNERLPTAPDHISTKASAAHVRGERVERPADVAASRWAILVRGVGTGATWGLVAGGGGGLLMLPYVFVTVPFGIVFGTAGGLLSGFAAAVLMSGAELVRRGSAARYSRVLSGLGTPLTMLVVFALWPDWFTYNGITSGIYVAIVAVGVGVGAVQGPFIADGADGADGWRLRCLKIAIPVLIAAGMAVVCWEFIQSVD